MSVKTVLFDGGNLELKTIAGWYYIIFFCIWGRLLKRSMREWPIIISPSAKRNNRFRVRFCWCEWSLKAKLPPVEGRINMLTLSLAYWKLLVTTAYTCFKSQYQCTDTIAFSLYLPVFTAGKCQTSAQIGFCGKTTVLIVKAMRYVLNAKWIDC